MMRAIEINSKTDKKGHLKINFQLNSSERNVRVLILLDDDTSYLDDEKLWVNSIFVNPTFDFLKDPSEDIYSLNDGEPFHD